MNRFFNTTVFCCLLILLESCEHTGSGFEKKDETYKEVAVNKLGANPAFSYNTGKTHVLIYKQLKPAAENPLPPLRFFVYDIKNDTLIYENSIPAGSVKWKNDTQIEVTLIEGNISTERKENQNGYLFDVISKKRINK
jgi:hypothetical protein